MLNKQLAYILLFPIILSACQNNGETQSKTSEAQFYGEKISIEDSKPLSQLMTLMQGSDSASVKLDGQITKTCAKKGCWMMVEDGQGKEIRVTFKDYGFFVPKSGVEGKKVVFDGIVTKTVTSIEELRHYAQDAGASEDEIEQIKQAKEEYKFVANGVAIL